MQKQFYQSRNIPMEHPVSVLPVEPPARMHLLPLVKGLQQAISQQISSVQSSKSRAYAHKQTVNNMVLEHKQLQVRMHEQERAESTRSKQLRHSLQEKDQSILLLFCEVERLSRIRGILETENLQLQESHSELVGEYQSRLSEYKYQLVRKSQDQLIKVKDSFQQNLSQIKQRYTEQLKTLVMREQADSENSVNYKEVIEIIKAQNAIVRKQKEDGESEIRQLRDQYREKLNSFRKQSEQSNSKIDGLTVQKYQLQLKVASLGQNCKRMMELNKTLKEKVEEHAQAVVSLDMDMHQSGPSQLKADKDEQVDALQRQVSSLKGQIKRMFENLKQSEVEKQQLCSFLKNKDSVIYEKEQQLNKLALNRVPSSHTIQSLEEKQQELVIVREDLRNVQTNLKWDIDLKDKEIKVLNAQITKLILDHEAQINQKEDRISKLTSLLDPSKLLSENQTVPGCEQLVTEDMAALDKVRGKDKNPKQLNTQAKMQDYADKSPALSSEDDVI